MTDFKAFQQSLFGPSATDVRAAVEQEDIKNNILSVGQAGARQANLFNTLTGVYDRDDRVKKATIMDNLKRAVDADIAASGDTSILSDPEKYALKVATKASALGMTEVAYNASMQRRLLENERRRLEIAAAAVGAKKDASSKEARTVTSADLVLARGRVAGMGGGFADLNMKSENDKNVLERAAALWVPLYKGFINLGDDSGTAADKADAEFQRRYDIGNPKSRMWGTGWRMPGTGDEPTLRRRSGRSQQEESKGYNSDTEIVQGGNVFDKKTKAYKRKLGE